MSKYKVQDLIKSGLLVAIKSYDNKVVYGCNGISIRVIHNNRSIDVYGLHIQNGLCVVKWVDGIVKDYHEYTGSQMFIQFSDNSIYEMLVD